MTMQLTIGQVAKQAGIGVETIRFYERRGLIAEPGRRPSGYRIYQQDAVLRLRFIRKAKDVGFTLSEIRELLQLRVDPTSTCGDVRGEAQKKIAFLDERITEFEAMRDTLHGLVRRCRGKGPRSECPILDEFERQEDSDG